MAGLLFYVYCAAFVGMLYAVATAQEAPKDFLSSGEVRFYNADHSSPASPDAAHFLPQAEAA